jgi:hypothetical protein
MAAYDAVDVAKKVNPLHELNAELLRDLTDSLQTDEEESQALQDLTELPEMKDEQAQALQNLGSIGLGLGEKLCSVKVDNVKFTNVLFQEHNSKYKVQMDADEATGIHYVLNEVFEEVFEDMGENVSGKSTTHLCQTLAVDAQLEADEAAGIEYFWKELFEDMGERVSGKNIAYLRQKLAADVQPPVAAPQPPVAAPQLPVAAPALAEDLTFTLLCCLHPEALNEIGDMGEWSEYFPEDAGASSTDAQSAHAVPPLPLKRKRSEIDSC